VFCVPIEAARADALDLPLMVVANTEAQRTAFTVTVDYRHGTSTGISAGDRAATGESADRSRDATQRPHRRDHIFPLRYRSGGVLKRRGPYGGDGRPLSSAGKQPSRRTL